MKELLQMSRKEIDKVSVLDQVVAGVLTQVGASAKLDITDRHLRRILSKYKASGPKALIHGLRGRQGNRKTPQEKLDQVIELVRAKYDDFDLRKMNNFEFPLFDFGGTLLMIFGDFGNSLL